MLSHIKQLFIVLLTFSEYLPTKCVSLKDKTCMIKPALIDLNPVDFKYYPFMVCCKKIIVEFLAHVFLRIATVLKVLLILQ